MNQENEQRKPGDNMEQLKQDAAACGPGCCCSAKGASPGRMRWILGAVLLLAAGALAARALLRSDGTASQAPAPAFAAPQAAESKAIASVVAVAPESPTADTVAVSAVAPATPAPASVPPPPANTASAEQPSDTVIGKEIAAFADLNTLAADTSAVFVFLPAIGPTASKLPTAQMQGAARTLEAQGNKIGLFTLKAGSPDHGKIGAQVPMPAVLALVKGRGMSAVSGEITETKLVQGFVAASSGGGCGSGGGGCGPASAGCK